MSQVIGIDTGGTYTDAVLLDSAAGKVLKKSKAFTTRDRLEVGIRNSLLSLMLEPDKKVDKVVLSTTLATNAVVEGRTHETGLILIGKAPDGELPTRFCQVVQGRMNVKGRELSPMNEIEIISAIESMNGRIQAIAVSGIMSVRNPSHEIRVKEIIKKVCALPVVCGHELAGNLGFYERTVTAVLNAALLPIVTSFLNAIQTVLKEQNLQAPVYIVRGDGSIADLKTIRDRPIETILSGPAASAVGARYLTGLKEAVVADMGGTTTDTARLSQGTVKLSAKGAKIGRWQTRVKSIQLRTYALGGDSQIQLEPEGSLQIGPRRVLPACRGGREGVTPTDVLHVLGELEKWDTGAAKAALSAVAERAGKQSRDLAADMESEMQRLLADECLRGYGRFSIPVVAIGAPAGVWFGKAAKKYGFSLTVPQHFEVANAVGAAAAEIEEALEAIVRPGEEGNGFLVHTRFEREFFPDKKEAVRYAVNRTRADALRLAKAQGAKKVELSVDCRDVFLPKNQGRREYVESQILVIAKGRTL